VNWQRSLNGIVISHRACLLVVWLLGPGLGLVDGRYASRCVELTSERLVLKSSMYTVNDGEKDKGGVIVGNEAIA
jgi:hypothetical protein